MVPIVILRGIVYLHFIAVFEFIQRHAALLAIAPLYTRRPHPILAMHRGSYHLAYERLDGSYNASR